MTHVPFIKGETLPTQLLASVVSTAIQAVLIIPLVLFGRDYEGSAVTSKISEKSKPAGAIASLLYLIFFIASAADGVMRFIRFLNERFIRGGSIFMAALLIAVCVYCAYCGVEGLARSSIIAIILFFVMLILMAWTSRENFDPINFYFNGTGSGFWQTVIDDLARNGEITAAAFLIKNTNKGIKCGLYSLLAAKLVLTAAVNALIFGVLGDFALMTDYPFMETGSYTDAALFRQNDSLYLILWTISAVISISLFIRICAGLMAELVPNMRLCGSISGAIIFLISIIFMYSEINFAPLSRYIYGFAAAFLIFAIPLVALISAKGRKKDEKNT